MHEEMFEEMRARPAPFWEARYQRAGSGSTGVPGAALRQVVSELAPGTALELGCGRGDDLVWLAQEGWIVCGVEIAPTAISYARANAERAGVVERVRFEQHDLTRTFPEGRFDLVLTCFLAAFPREPVLARAVDAVAPGGHLLLIDHGCRAPWMWAPEGHLFPTPTETLASLGLDTAWTARRVEALPRKARGPDGQTATVLDNVVLVGRRSDHP